MHTLVIMLFVSILVIEYLIEGRGLLHPYAVLIPELLSGIVMLIVLVRLMSGVRIQLDWRYGLFLLALLFTIAFGYAIQDVPTGAMLAGVRSYLKYLPFFLLPAVHRFTRRQLTVQLTVLFVLALLQTPLAFYQRFVEFAERMHSGDPVRGTLTTSGNLSLFMIVAIAGVVILYLRGRFRIAALIVVTAWLFAPTTINETKATLPLLPFALLVPALTMNKKAAAVRRLVPLCLIGALAAAAFVGTYNYFIQYREYAEPLDQAFAGDNLRRYLYTGAANSQQEYVGRLDSIELALEHTLSDPLTFAFGYGAGNVSESLLPAFAGKYSDYYARLGVGQTQVTMFLWEIGVVGLLAYLFLYYLAARDALTLARSNDSAAALGQLWVVAMIIMTFGLLYKSLLSMNDFGYLFWYFSGVVAARAAAVRHGAALRRAPQRSPPSWRLAVEEPHAPAKG